jgi:hypothetical protein
MTLPQGARTFPPTPPQAKLGGEPEATEVHHMEWGEMKRRLQHTGSRERRQRIWKLKQGKCLTFLFGRRNL